MTRLISLTNYWLESLGLAALPTVLPFRYDLLILLAVAIATAYYCGTRWRQDGGNWLT